MMADDLLTTRQVQELLKVDRITIYRMLNDGRLKGVKVGQQWRFPREEIERIAGITLPASPEAAQAESRTLFPTHCVQAIQDLFSEVAAISALVVDIKGNPLTQVSHPCRFCQVMLQSPAGKAACQASWREFARQSATGSRYFTCHAGLQYISAPIIDQEKAVGYFLTGEFYWQAPTPLEEEQRGQRLAQAYGLPAETFQQASSTIPHISAELHERVEGWPKTAAHAVESILHERISFMDRLQQIASLTQI